MPKPRVSKPKVTKAGPKPQASLGGFTSTGLTNRRAYLYALQPQDLKLDLRPADRTEMMSKIRWGERNSGMVRQILGDCVLYAVGDGIRPQAQTSDSAWNDKAEAYFNAWAGRCDITGRFSFWDAQRIAERSWARDGDFFVAKVRDKGKNAKLQLIEAHRVCNPKEGQPPEDMWDGVQFGAYSEVVGYNVIRSDNTSRTILANAMMHIYDAEYASGARGLPMLQHSWNDVQDEMELLALEKSAAKDNAEITRILKRNGGEFGQDISAELTNDPYATSAIGSRLGGKFLALEPGEDLVSFQSQRPSPTFTGFLEAIQRDISRGILPYEFTSDPTKAGSAAIRLITAKADRVFSRHQGILIEDLCIPTWGYVIGDAIANGDLPDNPEWTNVSWTTPKRVTVDAGREAANDRADVELGLLSMSELYSQRGLDFRSEMVKRAQDMAFIVETAKASGIPIEMLYKPSNVQPGTIAATTTPTE